MEENQDPNVQSCNEYGSGGVWADAVVVPLSLKPQVLRCLHDSPFYGHADLRATTLAVKGKAFWA